MKLPRDSLKHGRILLRKNISIRENKFILIKDKEDNYLIK